MGDKSPRDSKKNMKQKASAKAAKAKSMEETRMPDPKVVGKGANKG